MSGWRISLSTVNRREEPDITADVNTVQSNRHESGRLRSNVVSIVNEMILQLNVKIEIESCEDLVDADPLSINVCTLNVDFSIEVDSGTSVTSVQADEFSKNIISRN